MTTQTGTPSPSPAADAPDDATPRTAAVAVQARRIVTPELVARLTRRATLGPNPETKAITSPLTGEVLLDLPLSTEADVERAFAEARVAQAEWAQTPVAERERVLLRFHDLALAQQGDLLDLVQLESGKARAHAFEEIADLAICSRHYGRNAAIYLRGERRPGAFPILSQATVLRHPKGVVGIVSPWNYPLSLSVTDAFAALVAGNAVVLRPDTLTSLTALRAVDILDQAGLPHGVLQVVLGSGATIGQAVLDRADYVCFTGSTETGREVAAGLGRRLVGVSLELGGKNPLIVRRDADLRRTVPGALRGVFASGGQLCMSIERLIVDQHIEPAFTAQFARAVKAMRLGPELSFGYDMGSLLNAAQLRAVTEHVDDARAKGAQVLAGGRARPDLGPYFYEPTVLAGVTPEMRCYREETFGPLVSIYAVPNDDAAVALANDTEYGLNASIFTRDIRAGRALAARIHAGTVNINEGYAAGWAAMSSPMGGMGASGIGRRHGAEGIWKYTEPQTIAVQRVTDFGAPFGLSDKTWASVLTTSLRAMKAYGRR